MKFSAAFSVALERRRRPVTKGREVEARHLRIPPSTPPQTGPGSGSTGHFQSGNPNVKVSNGAAMSNWPRNTYENASELTGMPELVLIPAPVTTTTFFALYSEAAISWSNAVDSGVTWIVGILERALRHGQRSWWVGGKCSLSGAFEPVALSGQTDHSSKVQSSRLPAEPGASDYGNNTAE